MIPHNYQIGQKIKHYCCGEIVEAEIIAVTPLTIKTYHKDIQWGDYLFNTTVINIYDDYTTPKIITDDKT